MSRPLITANMLVRQARERGRVEIAADAIITPAAQDWLRVAPVPVRRTGATAEAAPSPALYMVGDAANPNCQALLPMLERRYGAVQFWPCMGHRAGLLAAVANACAALAECSRNRAVVVVRDGAIVNCVANRHAHVRAAICDRTAHLVRMMGEMGLNLLILEHGRVSLRQMQGMIEVLVKGHAGIDPVVKSALSGEQPAGVGCGCGHADR